MAKERVLFVDDEMNLLKGLQVLFHHMRGSWHMAFATIAFIRGKALPPRLIATTQGVFMLLLLGLMLYVSIFDVRRWSRNEREDAQFEQERERMITPVFRSGLRESEKIEVSGPGIDDGES